MKHNMTAPTKNPAAVTLGTLGGKAGRGAAKARTVEQCRRAQKAAVRARLAKKQKTPT